MERLLRSPLLWAALSILVALSVLPKTSWVVRNNFEALAAGKITEQGLDVFHVPRMELVAGANSSAAGYTLALNMMVDGPSGFFEKAKRIREACLKIEPREVGIGLYLRYVSQGLSLRDPREPKANIPRDVNIEERLALTKQIVVDAKEGSLLQPDNALFSTIEWLALLSLKSPDAEEALLRASNCTDFDEYAAEDYEVQRQAYEGVGGYRGEIFRLSLLGGILFPHFATIKKGQLVVQQQASYGDQEQLAFVKLTKMMMRQSRSVIGILVAASIFRRALVPSPINISSDWDEESQKRQDAKVLAAAELFDKKHPDIHARQVAVQSADLRKTENVWPQDDILSILSEPRVIVSTCLLLAIPMVWMTFGLRKVFAMGCGTSWENVWPHLGWLCAIPAMWQPSSDILDPLLIIVPLVSAMVARKHQKVAVGIGLAYIGVIIWFVGVKAGTNEPISPILGVGILAFVIGQLKWSTKPWMALTVLLLGFLGAIGSVISVAGKTDLQALILLSALPVLAGLAAITFRAKLRSVDLVCWLTFLITLGYFGSVIWELRANEAIRSATADFVSEADRVRKVINLPPMARPN